MAEHTPTPWKIGPVTAEVNEVANVRGVTIIGPRKAVGCRDEAEHIVRCVNAHDDLTATMDLLADPENWGNDPDAIPVKPWDIARAAVEKARR